MSTRISRRALIRGLAASALIGACAPSGTPVRASTRPTPQRPWRIGGLYTNFPKDGGASLDAALSELGYVQGRDYVRVYRYAEGDATRLPDLAAELVGLKVDIIICNPPEALVAHELTNTIPIVFRGIDPRGLVRAGGNVTGVSGNPDINAKGLELMHAVVPSLARMAIMYTGAEGLATIRAGEKYAGELGFRIIPVEIETVREITPALERALRERPQAIGFTQGPSFFGTGLPYFAPVLDFAHRERLPQLYGGVEFVRAGGFMSIGANLAQAWRLMAERIEKVLRDGATPGDLPVVTASVYAIVINLSAARKLGLTIPDGVLRHATEVIP